MFLPTWVFRGFSFVADIRRVLTETFEVQNIFLLRAITIEIAISYRCLSGIQVITHAIIILHLRFQSAFRPY